MPVPPHRYPPEHTTNGGANAPNCRILIDIFCANSDCADRYAVRIEGFIGGAWVELASGSVTCVGAWQPHDLKMVRALPRGEVRVRGVFTCADQEQTGADRVIFAACDH